MPKERAMRQGTAARQDHADTAARMAGPGSARSAAQASALNGAPRVQTLLAMKDTLAQRAASAAPGPNRTGMPDRLKAGVEAVSGVPLDGVRVHYNSAKPARVGALAYAQGSDIHLAPGQERHLSHEVAHVVQQAQGRVRPTARVGGMPINDDAGLEREADRIGQAAQRWADPAASRHRTSGNSPDAGNGRRGRGLGGGHAVLQRAPYPPGEPDTHNWYNARRTPGVAWNGEKPDFGDNLRVAVLATFAGVDASRFSGETAVTALGPAGAHPVVRATSQLDHTPSWKDRITQFGDFGDSLSSDSALAQKWVQNGIYTRVGNTYKITAYGARMYYNDFGSLIPARGGDNASGGSKSAGARAPEGSFAAEAVHESLMSSVANYTNEFYANLNGKNLTPAEMVGFLQELSENIQNLSHRLKQQAWLFQADGPTRGEKRRRAPDEASKPPAKRRG